MLANLTWERPTERNRDAAACALFQPAGDEFHELPWLPEDSSYAETRQLSPAIRTATPDNNRARSAGPDLQDECLRIVAMNAVIGDDRVDASFTLDQGERLRV